MTKTKDLNPNLVKTIERIARAEPPEAPRAATLAENAHVTSTYKRGAAAVHRMTGKKPNLPPWLQKQ
jgi:hypothetical protein